MLRINNKSECVENEVLEKHGMSDPQDTLRIEEVSPCMQVKWTKDY